MTLRTTIVFGTSALVVALSACGGSLNGGDASNDGGNGGDVPGSDGGTGCRTSTLPADRACVPGTARSNTPIFVEVAATEGCLGCTTSLEPCKVDVTGTTIVVSLITTSCEASGVACPAVCQLVRTTCTLPALAVGTYTVNVSGEPAGSALSPRTLVVADEATATSCTLPPAGEKAAPLDGTVYATTCMTDDDCVIATSGNVCGTCKCPDTAIAKSAFPAYDADYRAKLSQCEPDKTELDCVACPDVRAMCQLGPPGTCKLVPSSH
jgi:hypothetical protein